MQERILELIVHILNEIKTRKATLTDINVKNLEEMGFSNSELNAAFSWLFDRMYMFNKICSHKEVQKSFRLLHEIEKLAITPEAYGYLIQLRELEIIDDKDFELIIDRVMLNYSQTVELEEMISIVAYIIFQQDKNIYGSQASYENELIN